MLFMTWGYEDWVWVFSHYGCGLKVVLEKLVNLHYNETGINARGFGPIFQIIA